MRRVGVAMVGQGPLGRMHCQLLTRFLDDKFELVGSFQRNPRGEHAVSWKQYAMKQLDELVLSNPAVDAVMVCSPDETHEDITRQALKAGKHVFCEKPLALRSAATPELYDLAFSKHKVIQIGYQRRFDPRFQGIRERIIAHGVSVKQLDVKSLDPFQYDPAKENLKTLLFNSICHDIDQALWFCYPFDAVELVNVDHQNETVVLDLRVLKTQWDKEGIKVKVYYKKTGSQYVQSVTVNGDPLLSHEYVEPHSEFPWVNLYLEAYLAEWNSFHQDCKDYMQAKVLHDRKIVTAGLEVIDKALGVI
jgi:predicted dehydrogenase